MTCFQGTLPKRLNINQMQKKVLDTKRKGWPSVAVSSDTNGQAFPSVTLQ